MSYRDFEGRLELVKKKVNASELVELAFERKIGKIKKKDIVELWPSISISAVEKGIMKLLNEGKIRKEGNVKNN